ncbi:family 16 glycoside hydrolase [Runella sp.]|uniref:family 16 glycoside hydrolase n=1 Tax=Runella sp. TaxID=1960881 RepID=UPI003D1413E4
MSFEKLQGIKVVKVIKDSTVKAVDEPTFVKIKGVDFQDGTIEVKVLSRLLKTARSSDRGFIGVAFRIHEDNSKFECIYIRPTNGRAEDQVRRNHSIQYFSYPDFKFDRLRKESPEKYETYADMGLNEWITIRIEVKGKQANLFLNDSRQPTLIVNDLKMGENASGALGLFVDVGTEGYFKDLKITKH